MEYKSDLIWKFLQLQNAAYDTVSQFIPNQLKTDRAKEVTNIVMHNSQKLRKTQEVIFSILNFLNEIIKELCWDSYKGIC